MGLTAKDIKSRLHYGIQACTCGPLTYIRSYRCASTLFYRSFVDNHRWKEIEYNEIDWRSSRVFSHIRHPLEKRFKSISHWLLSSNNAKRYLNDSEFQKVIDLGFGFDNHTSSYFDLFGLRCNNIDWIPISGKSHEQVLAETTRYLNLNGILLVNYSTEFNEGSKELHDLEKSVKHNFEKFEEVESYSLLKYLYNDFELYENIIDRFYPAATTLKEMSWLKI